MWKVALLQVCTNPGRNVAATRDFFFLFSGVLYLWVLRMELGSCHPSGSWIYGKLVHRCGINI